VNPERIVVGTSIFLPLLLRRKSVQRRRFQTESGLRLYSPRFFLIELFKHKERIIRASELQESELLEALHELLSKIYFVEEGNIKIGTWMEARRLCADIDLKDSPFVALSLHLGARLWTSDEELKSGLLSRGFHHFYEVRSVPDHLNP
jgi:predicted nucleic acid-binding protein